MKRRKRTDYINNKDFYQAMVEYKAAIKAAEETQSDPPPIPNYIGQCIMDIATRLSYKGNFVNYTYRDDMVADGIENGIAALKSFDPEKTQNPFAYFTTTINYAFIRRIQKERKNLYIKHKVIENSLITNTAVEQSKTGPQTDPGYIDITTDYMNDFVENYEAALAEKKAKAKARIGLEKFCEEEKESNADE